MTQGLSVSDVVSVDVSIAPTAAPYKGFNNLLVLGYSPVIDVNERIRLYSGGDTALASIAADFGTSAPEYLAAAAFFGQSPQPDTIKIGRWAQTATAGILRGGILAPVAQTISRWTTITAGSMIIPINGVSRTISGVNFSGALNLNGVASILSAALPAGVTCTWDSVYGRFSIFSNTTGANSSVGFATPTGSGQDLTYVMRFAGTAATAVPGVAAEDVLDCVANLIDVSNEWYGLALAQAAPSTTVSVSDHIDIATLIEASGRIYGITIKDTAVLDSTSTDDLASQIQALGFKRTFFQYSSTNLGSSNPYAIFSWYGRAFTVDFTAQNSVLTMKFKQEPGVIPEVIPESQAAAVKAKNCNIYVQYSNGTAFIQEGVMANGYFFDEVHGLDWLANRVQTDIFNTLYQALTKVPQTNAGMNQLKNAANGSCAAAVYNGLVAEGLWTGPSIGSQKTGTVIPGGFYIYMPPVETQAQPDREARKAPTMQVLVKLAGAVHEVNVIINVSR